MHPVFATLGLGPDVLIIGAIILVLFGAERLPKLARSMGQAKKEFESAAHGPPPNQSGGSAAQGGAPPNQQGAGPQPPAGQ